MMVGLFWFVEEGGHARILAQAVTLDQATAYGHMLTIETGHLEFWTALAQRGASALRAEGFPTAPVWAEYEEFPRGRVLYDQVARQFAIRADKQLHRQAFLKLIANHFDIRLRGVALYADDHYRSIRRVRPPS